MHIALSAAASVKHHNPLIVTGHVHNHLSGFRILHDGSLRNLDDHVFPVGAMALFLFAGLSVARRILAHMTEIAQGIHALIHLEYDIASPAAVSAVRSAGGNKQFSAETHMTVSASSRFNNDFCTVGKHNIPLRSQRGSIR